MTSHFIQANLISVKIRSEKKYLKQKAYYYLLILIDKGTQSKSKNKFQGQVLKINEISKPKNGRKLQT